MFKDLARYLKAAALLTVLALAVLVTLHLIGAEAGAFVDWIVGIVGLWWLGLITTVPWTLYFEAREAEADAAASRERGIAVDASRLALVGRLGRRALAGAVLLHLLTAAALYAVAVFGLSPVGYAGAGLALALTVARPSARAYRYLAAQVSAFRREVHYPREDVVALRSRLQKLEGVLSLRDKESWAFQVQALATNADVELAVLTERVHQLIKSNQSEHARLEHEYRSALATVTEDRQFVEHLREIVRFVRRA